MTQVQYKYYPYLLSDEVVNRHNIEGKFFEEVELWYLVYSIIQAAASFHSKGSKVGDIQPKNVFISPEGQVRVATQHTWPGEQANYFKTIFEKETTYLCIYPAIQPLKNSKISDTANSMNPKTIHSMSRSQWD